jgi:hypothetical protein
MNHCSILNNGAEGVWLTQVGGLGVRDNLIRANQYGIVISATGANVTGISSNAIFNNLLYELKNSGSAAVLAPNNFWGEPTTTELANNVRNLTKVYDSQDDASVGQVVLKPYLAVNPSPFPPAIIGEPQNLTVGLGSTATFTVTASSETPMTYQWYRGATPFPTGTNNWFSLPNAQLSSAGTNYFVVVANSDGAVTSRWATLTVLPYPADAPAIGAQPVAQSVSVGGEARFTVTATGTSLSYQWYFNNVAISGATGFTLTIPAAGTEWVGAYKVVITNLLGSVTSQTVGLWLSNLKMYAGVNAYGPVGGNCLVEYTTNVAPPVTWLPLQTVTIVTNPTVIIDYDSPGQPQRFYRTLPQ